MIKEEAPKEEAPKDEPPLGHWNQRRWRATIASVLVAAAATGRIGGNGNAGKWSWYASQVQSRIQQALQRNPKTRAATMSVKVRVWPDVERSDRSRAARRFDRRCRPRQRIAQRSSIRLAIAGAAASRNAITNHAASDGAAASLTAIDLFQCFCINKLSPPRDARRLCFARRRASLAQRGQRAEPQTVRSASGAVTSGRAAPAPKPTPSENVTINLLHRMVERGLLKEEDADELIKEAENDAAIARTAAKRAKSKTGAQRLSKPPPAEGETPKTEAKPARMTTVSVSYVPDIVKQQLRDEIRADVMEQARNENWANPRTFPSWVSRFTPFADIRLRYDGTFYPSGNDNTGAFPNFNAINTGPPFDITGTTFSPQLNVDQDRQRARIRVRVGAADGVGRWLHHGHPHRDR